MRSFIVAIAVLAAIAVLMFTRSEPKTSVFGMPPMPCEATSVSDAQTLCLDIDLASTQIPHNDLHAIMHPCHNFPVDLGNDYMVVVSAPNGAAP
ncbi:hypothetical protein HY630_01500 [Candidatus Uhrbacteria bacterium]|nr:hypothetical protein [Candidatus Uhrbacteria bacterium]